MDLSFIICLTPFPSILEEDRGQRKGSLADIAEIAICSAADSRPSAAAAWPPPDELWTSTMRSPSLH